jgi:oligopeptidase B
MQPPIVEKKPKKISLHDDTRIDDYFWLRDKENPEVMKYLEAENAYMAEIMAPAAELEEKIFNELKGRIKERDESVPAFSNGYYRYSRYEEGKEYPILARKEGSLDAPEDIVLDMNIFGAQHEFVKLGNYEWSHDSKTLAYSLDTDGSESFTLKFRNLETGKDLPDEITGTYYGCAWANDHQTLFYIKLDDNLRPYQVWRHKLGTPVESDVLVYEETDKRFFLSVWSTRSDKYIVIHAEGNNTSEVHYLEADTPTKEFTCFAKRNFGVEYSIDHQNDHFFITTNEDAIDFKVLKCPIDNTAKDQWQEFLPHQLGRLIEGISCFKDYALVALKEHGVERIRVFANDGSHHDVEFPESVATVGIGTNFTYDTDVIRLGYSSPITPSTVFDYHVSKKSLETKKVQEIPSGYDKTQYQCEMVYAKVRDGKEVPMTIVYRKDLKKDGNNPCYLWAYGSYGMGISSSFSPNWLSLMDRGFVCGIAHIRGGDRLGRTWYEDGKMLTKMNTFNDYIDCAKHLISDGWTSKGKIAGVGGSAGGMLMGAVANMAGDLFGAIVAHVPFVDCLNTMLDDSLPLTAMEYNEWGNPNEKVYYDAIKSYSPYDNVEAKDYPNLLITAGLNDPRVTYWEPAKWTAKLRELKTNDNVLLLKTNMGAGHAGVSGRFESLKEKALEYTFITKMLGVE